MELVNCDDLAVVQDRLYGGLTGSKIAVRYNGRVWMLKSCERLRDKNFKNVELSYANDPVSEYIGSNVYGILGIPVQDTLLGSYKGRLCVLCSDDAYPGRLFEFREFRNALFDEDITQVSSGMSTSIADIMQVIEMSDRIPTEDTKQRFWQMFAIDALIGNTDRNNGNWGFVFEQGVFQLYGVYDCGGSLNNKRSDGQMRSDLECGRMQTLALNYTLNFKNEAGRRINPFKYLEQNEHVDALQVFSEKKLQEILDFVNGVDIISDVRKLWYSEILRIRFEKLLKIRNVGSASSIFS